MTFTFYVALQNGQKLTISTLGADDTVLALKEKIEEMEGTPKDMLRFVFKGHALTDASTLAQSGIEADVTVHLILSLRAGQ